jgi:hypothetical protein
MSHLTQNPEEFVMSNSREKPGYKCCNQLAREYLDIFDYADPTVSGHGKSEGMERPSMKPSPGST